MKTYENLPEAVERLREHTRQVAEYTSKVTVTLESRDGLVEVTVGHGGAVKEVRIHRSAYRELAPEQLGELITRTCGIAAEAVDRKVSAAYLAAFGADVDPLKVARGEVDMREAMAAAKRRYVARE